MPSSQQTSHSAFESGSKSAPAAPREFDAIAPPRATAPSSRRTGIVRGVALDLFAGIRVSDYEASRAWYERLLGREPSFIPHATEAVWELAEHRFLFIEENAGGAGGATLTVFVDDLDSLVADVALRGIEPAERETYSNGVRKALYRDPDGNEIGFGGAPAGE